MNTKDTQIKNPIKINVSMTDFKTKLIKLINWYKKCIVAEKIAVPARNCPALWKQPARYQGIEKPLLLTSNPFISYDKTFIRNDI